MKRLTPRLLLILGLLALTLLLAGTALAQDTSWCVSPDGTPVGCAQITLTPAGTTGDFFVADAPLATAQNPGRLILPAGTYTVNVKNVTSTEAGFGTLFVYNDASTTVTLTAGKVVSKSVTLTKKYIRGTLTLTCDVRGAVAGTDDVSCSVAIDGAPQPDLLAPGTSHSYILDPGTHAVTTTLVGASAIYWTPASANSNTSITAGKTATLKPRFDKLGHLIVNLDQPNVVGDFYLDGALIASQAATIDQWVTPSKSHKVEVKAITDPAANGLYYWKDATSTALLSAGQTKTLTVKLTKVWLKGFIELTCAITNPQPGMSCSPVLDGVQQSLVPQGGVVTYTTDPGKHTLVVTIDPASQWGSTPKTFNAQVIGGKTYKANANLTAKVPTYSVTVVNNSYTAICNVFITPVGSSGLAPDSLSGQIGVGQSKTFTVPQGTYDLYAENCKNNPMQMLGSVPLTGGDFVWTVTGPAAYPGGSPTTLRVINKSGIDICLVQIVPSDMGVGGTQNWLRPGQVLGNGQSQDMQINSGMWDVYATSCDGHYYWAESHQNLTPGSWSITLLGE